jgi:hypothetical protein
VPQSAKEEEESTAEKKEEKLDMLYFFVKEMREPKYQEVPKEEKN